LRLAPGRTILPGAQPESNGTEADATSDAPSRLP
jgi:hypothetical protein